MSTCAQKNHCKAVRYASNGPLRLVRCCRTSMSPGAGELGKMTIGFRYAHETFLFHVMRCGQRQVYSSVIR